MNYGNVIIEIGGRGERKKKLNCDNLIAERERERERERSLIMAISLPK